MNAGTAQRITLNLLSTLVMIRLGRVYRGMMVDVQSANVKLDKRKKAMVGYLTGRTEEEVQAALDRASGNVKLAVLLLHGCEAEAAGSLLQKAGGRLREAIELVDESIGSDAEHGQTPSRASQAKSRNAKDRRALV